MDGSKDVELRDSMVGTRAETVDDAVAEARRERQEARERLRSYHAPEAHKARERARQRHHEAHADRERQRRVEYEQTRARAEERNARMAGKNWEPDVSWKSRWDQYRRPAIGTGIVSLVALLIWAIFFWHKTITVEVEQRTWERSQGIEQYKQLHGSNWCDQAPGDRYNNSSRRKQDGTRTVVDCYNCDCRMEQVRTGQTCREVNCRTVRTDNGNGSFSADRVCDQQCDPTYEDRKVCRDRTHEEPVYRDWCTYDYDRWTEVRRPRQSGGSSIEPVWPDLGFNDCGEQRLGCERPGSRKSQYTVHFADLDSSEKYTCDYTQEVWNDYEEGSTWEAIVKVIGGRFQCESLTGEGGGSSV
jgi:hypothetical protein